MTDAAEIAAANRGAAETSWSGPTEAIVEGIVAVLCAELPRDLKVEEMPDNPKTFDLGEHEAAALVHYRGSKYARARSNGLTAQDRDPALDIHLIVRGLSGHLGAYALIDLTRLALQGRTIAGLTLDIVSDGLNVQSDSLWTYVVGVVGTMPAVGIHRGVLDRHPELERNPLF